MGNLALQYVALALLLQSASGSGQGSELPRVSATARDLYIGCSLYVRDAEVEYSDKRAPPYSALSCIGAEINALGYSRMIQPGNEWEYCIPENASTAADRSRAMAMQYLEFYERYGFRDPNKQGLTMMLYAFKTGWPCR